MNGWVTWPLPRRVTISNALRHILPSHNVGRGTASSFKASRSSRHPLLTPLFYILARYTCFDAKCGLLSVLLMARFQGRPISRVRHSSWSSDRRLNRYVCHSPTTGVKLIKPGKEYIVGRKDCALVINDKKVSRKHQLFAVGKYSAQDVVSDIVTVCLQCWELTASVSM